MLLSSSSISAHTRYRYVYATVIFACLRRAPARFVIIDTRFKSKDAEVRGAAKIAGCALQAQRGGRAQCKR